jgi:hypothetical protein
MSGTRRRSIARRAREALAERHGDELALVVYELLDAHDDTVRLGEGLESDLRWRAHVDYLRGLQRVGREALARGTARESTEIAIP